MFSSNPPLGLYIHLPWCEKKCPYCDFNSHESEAIPEQRYVEALLNDLEQDLPLIWGRSIDSIFIGGGTPSLFSGEAIERLFSGLRALLNFAPAIEISMESNPGSAEAERYSAYFESGVNRLSIGVQSFDDRHLSLLGRVHTAQQAYQAVDKARQAGFDNINIDLMYGLPRQSLAQARQDTAEAIKLAPTHISLYQLTIEANTLFHHQPPGGMPDDELGWQQQLACQALLFDNAYQQYEISAYCRDGLRSQHNMNYWQFGDYIGIGAGAHGKITLGGENRVLRRQRQRQPRAYLEHAGRNSIISETELGESDLLFEFMLNALRLRQGFASSLFHENTGLAFNLLLPGLEIAKQKGLIEYGDGRITPSSRGFRFLNDLQALFLQAPKAGNRPIIDATGEIIHS